MVWVGGLRISLGSLVFVFSFSALIRKIGSGPSTAYTLQVDSIESLTQLQVAMEQLKKQMQ